ncbi:MAG TPA: urea amidolyase family protein [Arthrobacter sp.]|jgi:KipI family sensor histidine kinase inhibitor|uniref:5-oxoprolinase subunit B/C family protein n=1 Tax=Arthrobacter sp. TaxID=1667 RepID=UPI002F3EDDAE
MKLTCDPIPAATETGRAGRIRGVRHVGQRALLAEVEHPEDVLALQEHLTANPLIGQLEVISAAETVMVTCTTEESARRIRQALLNMTFPPRQHGVSALVRIDVVYDGEDLRDIAAHCGLSPEAVINVHSAQTWTAAFTGFSPGLAYLVGENNVLNVPRRPSPRTSVPTGSVALAGKYSSVYPRQSPGGWQIIGHTRTAMWDLARESPALVTAGTEVIFQPVRAFSATSSHTAERPSPAREAEAGLRVLQALPLTLIQDLGRAGHAAIGVSASGAMDRPSLKRANRIVGNAPGAAALEIVDGGLGVEATADQVLALTGAPVELHIASPHGARTAEMAQPFALLTGEILTLGKPTSGFRSYLAARGGFDTPEVLGSQSTDTMSGLGPAPITPGQLLTVAPVKGINPVGWPEVQPDLSGPVAAVLDITLGPRDDWFSDEALSLLGSASWTASNELNRVGMRLEGPKLQWSRTGELPSEGTISGCIQVPPSGQPVVFLSDHPTTGGYPVIAVLAETQLAKAAQIRPGTTVRFRIVPHQKETTDA